MAHYSYVYQNYDKKTLPKKYLNHIYKIFLDDLSIYNVQKKL